MAYTINKTDGTVLLSLEDYLIVDDVLSIKLVGKNASGYGEAQNENFVKMLENFAFTSPPANMVTGQLWFDKNSSVLRPKVYDGSAWRPIAVLEYSDTQSTSSQLQGDFWFDSTSKQLHVNNGAGYTLIGPEAAPGFATTKLLSTLMYDAANTAYPVIQTIINGEVVSVMSAEQFNPNSAGVALGYDTVFRGITFKNYNIADRYPLSGDFVLHGKLEHLDQTYPRRDQDEAIDGNWIFNNDVMLQFGSAAQSKIQYVSSANTLRIEHAAGTLQLSSNGSNLTYQGDALYPNTANSQDLGTTTKRFNNVFAKTLSSGGPLVAGAMVGNWSLGDASKISPESDNGATLGGPSLRFANVYTFNLNAGSDLGTLKGDWQLDNAVSLKPKTDGSSALGGTNKRFSNVYTQGITSGDPVTPLTVVGDLSMDGTITPKETLVYNLGSPTSKWNTIYSASVQSDVAAVGSLSATVNSLFDSYGNTINRFDNSTQLGSSNTRLPTQNAVKVYVDTIKNQLLAQIAALQASIQASLNALEFVPAGAVFHVAMSTAPTGFLVADGSSKLISAYPKLFAAIGNRYGGDGTTTFNLPDLRGEFIRGWDLGRGVDPNRLFGSNQDDEFGSHKHGITLSQEQGGSHDQYGFPQVDWTGPMVYHGPEQPDSSWSYRNGTGNPLSSTGGAETRPKNIALLPIIKF